MLKSGKTFEHDWIQVLPFGAIFVAFALTNNYHQHLRSVSMVLAVVSILDLGRQINAGCTPVPGTSSEQRPSSSQQAASLIEGDRKEGDQVFVMKSSMIYYYLRQRPPSKSYISACLERSCHVGIADKGDIDADSSVRSYLVVRRTW